MQTGLRDGPPRWREACQASARWTAHDATTSPATRKAVPRQRSGFPRRGGRHRSDRNLVVKASCAEWRLGPLDERPRFDQIGHVETFRLEVEDRTQRRPRDRTIT